MRNLSLKLNKMPVFQFFRNIKGNSFRGHNLTLFSRSRIFPSIYDKNPLWEKYNLLKNHSKSANENCSLFPLFFHFLDTLLGECPKYHQNSSKVIEFFYVTCQCIRFSLRDILRQTKFEKILFLSNSQPSPKLGVDITFPR